MAEPGAEIIPRDNRGMVGFSQLSEQLRRDLLRNGFEFTVMVVGESGLGKSTLLNSLFLSDVYQRGSYPPPSERISKTMEIESTVVDMEENGVRLRLTLVDTPGFGDNLDNSHLVNKIVEYIEKQYDSYVELENRVNRYFFKDSRVHALLYFLSPNVHGVKALDIEAMKALHKKVNLIPIVAKADTLNATELACLKQRVQQVFVENQIEMFRALPFNEADPEDVERTRSLLASMPFAVVGSNTIIEEGGKKFRGRRYPWGTLNIENENVSDFSKLRTLFIRRHMQDLYVHTHQVLYEDYRVFKFSTLGFSATASSNLIEAFEHEQLEQERQMKKIDDDLKRIFDSKVKEKEAVLQAEDTRLQGEFDVMLAEYQKEKSALEDRVTKLKAELHRLQNPAQETTKKRKPFGF